MRPLTIAFTTHRPEMIPLAEAMMQEHDVVLLEEPPAPEFKPMLEGRMSIEDYLAPLDLEYPEYSRRMCLALRKIHGQGIELIQTDPYMEELLSIHEFLAEGFAPADLPDRGIRRAVYEKERSATGALLAYYRTVMSASFDEALCAVQNFARRDASRFRLRDRLRAIAVTNRARRFRRPLVEAGVIHYALYPLLRKGLGDEFRVFPNFLAADALRRSGKKGRRLCGPGDRLTLLHIFHPGLPAGRHQTDLLAARALIHAKIIAKSEITESAGRFPHLADEAETIERVNRLSMEDCRGLFPVIRRLSTESAGEAVARFLGRTT